MLTTDLYSFVITGHDVGSELRAMITLNESSSIYTGHFPGFPITPGVCQVMMIKEILVEELKVPLQLSKAKAIKFLAMHEPGKVKKIQTWIKYEMAENRMLNVNAQLFEGETKFLSFKGEFIQHA